VIIGKRIFLKLIKTYLEHYATNFLIVLKAFDSMFAAV
jgi:hypothetical protein